MIELQNNNTAPKIGRWFGPAGLVAAGIFVLGRLALEPARSLPQFDDDSMESFAATEVYRLRKDAHPVEVAIFGSSVTIWGVLPELVASELGEKPESVRKLAIQGGTAFDMWNLVRRNPEKFEHLKLAVIEIGPRTLDSESDRVSNSVSQHGTVAQRLMFSSKSERAWHLAEWVLPLESVRRPLKTVFLNIVNPDSGNALLPEIDSRLYPEGAGWAVPAGPHSPYKLRAKITADDAARFLVDSWKVSKIHDDAMHRLLAWLCERNIKIVLYQTPIHPDVMARIRSNPKYAADYARYLQYEASLGIAQDCFIKSEDITDCGIPIDGLRDYTHLNERGAKLYSRYLGERIRAVVRPREDREVR